ncbi:subtilisin-like protein [Aureobasidium pullulans]|nr:subtilisin-like protein [Aureobasidium pullulans]
MPSMHLSTFGMLALLLPNVIAAPTSNTAAYAIKERHAAPLGWTRMSSPADSQIINLQIALRQENSDALTKIAMEVSDPSHPRYGQHLSAKQLLGQGIDTAILSPTRDWITVDLPVRKVESLLKTTYSNYRYTDGSTLMRTSEWSLPESLHENIDLIQPTTSFFRTVKPSIRQNLHHGPMRWHQGAEVLEPGWNYGSNGSACNITDLCNRRVTTLHCLRCLYGTANYKAQAPEKNMIAVTNYLNQTQKRSDIRRYLEIFRPKAAPVANTFPIVPIANASDNQGPLEPGETPSIEGDMDGELVIGISWPTSFMAFSTGGSPPFLPDLATPTNNNEPYLEWRNYLLAQDTLPQVITTSYGDFEQTIPVPYMTRVCEGFEKLAARGVSVIFSSGDTGVGPSDACISNSNSSQSMFLPAFPASCPWVTAVGATQDFEPEVAVSAFGSGAGFSDHFAMPDYQVDAVNGYLEKIGDMHTGLYNRSGRAYPDVAAQGVRIAIVTELRQIAGAGTSASAPIFAAVIALVNDARLAAGKPVLGFLNPWIYGGAFAAFTDVKDGSSVGCDTDGFPAADGWDAVTGFGTPNFTKLVEEALSVYEA